LTCKVSTHSQQSFMHISRPTAPGQTSVHPQHLDCPVRRAWRQNDAHDAHLVLQVNLVAFIGSSAPFRFLLRLLHQLPPFPFKHSKTRGAHRTRSGAVAQRGQVFTLPVTGPGHKPPSTHGVDSLGCCG
jgi:hypothetical protein